MVKKKSYVLTSHKLYGKYWNESSMTIDARNVKGEKLRHDAMVKVIMFPRSVLKTLFNYYCFCSFFFFFFLFYLALVCALFVSKWQKQMQNFSKLFTAAPILFYFLPFLSYVVLETPPSIAIRKQNLWLWVLKHSRKITIESIPGRREHVIFANN